jgi:TolB protein
LRSRNIRLGAVLCCAAAAGAAVSAAPAAAGGELTAAPPELVSQTPAGTAGNGISGTYGLAVSGDGRSVAFSSTATDLMPNDQDASPDIYVRRLDDDTTELASVTGSGEKGDAISTRPSLSYDGDRVAFLSAASNLDPAGGEPTVDAYVKDLYTGELTRVSESSTGERANGQTSAVAISDNGRVVAFVSDATNLDPRDTDAAPDVYVANARGRVSLVSIAPDGNKPQAQYSVGDVSLSANGRWVAFSTDAALDPADTNNRSDVYVKDRWTGALILASATADGVIGNAASSHPVLTARGHTVVFSSFADNLDGADPYQDSDIYRKNLRTGELTLVSTNSAGEKGADSSSTPTISGDGRRVAFASYATNLDNQPHAQRGLDVYVKDLRTGLVVNVSGPAPAEPSGIVSLYPALPFRGSSVAFASNSTHFTTADSRPAVSA